MPASTTTRPRSGSRRAASIRPSARELADLAVTPGQATKRTRDGRRDYIDTIAFKVASGDLSPRQGAARAGSSR